MSFAMLLSLQKSLLSSFSWLVNWQSITIAMFLVFIFMVVRVSLDFFMGLDCDLSLCFNEVFLKLRRERVCYIKEKVVWITGASSGIGEALAYELVPYNVKLVLSGRNEERIQKVKQNCISAGCSDSNIITITFDIRNIEDHRTALESVLKQFGSVDIFVSNAGTSQRSCFEAIESRVDHDLFDNNVFGGVNLTRLILKHWYDTNSKGHIVVTSSIVGKAALPNCGSYTASKHALHGFYECLRLEAAFKGITITMVCSGPVKTNITAVSYTGTRGVLLNSTGITSLFRMCPKRHAELMVCAIETRLEEVWITIQPFLLYCYANQYFPTLTKRYLIGMANNLSKSRDN